MGEGSVRVVVSEFPPASGWDTVTLMAELLARCLGAELVRVPHEFCSTRRARVLSVAPRATRSPDVTVVVAPQPVHLYAALGGTQWLRRSGLVAGWVVDAFWTDRIPRVARGLRHYDRLFVTDREVVDEWSEATGVPTGWIPFGADVLDRGSNRTDRDVDVLRVGRQPSDWADDDTTADRLAGLGLTFGGRTPSVPSADGNQRALHDAMSRAKVTLSFGNRSSPAGYTHPTREYLTGRWLDALANGATVAGTTPDCAASERLLWPEATVDLGGPDAATGLPVLAEAVRDWVPDRARLNHLRALERVDWRWRFAELAEALGIEAAPLRSELVRLEAAVARSAAELR